MDGTFLGMVGATCGFTDLYPQRSQEGGPGPPSARDDVRVLAGNKGCLLCDRVVRERELLSHLEEVHPDRFDVFETWPEGAVVVVHTDAAA